MRSFIQQTAQIHSFPAGDKFPELFSLVGIQTTTSYVVSRSPRTARRRLRLAATPLSRRNSAQGGAGPDPPEHGAAPGAPRPDGGGHGGVGGELYLPAPSAARLGAGACAAAVVGGVEVLQCPEKGSGETGFHGGAL